MTVAVADDPVVGPKSAAANGENVDSAAEVTAQQRRAALAGIVYTHQLETGIVDTCPHGGGSQPALTDTGHFGGIHQGNLLQCVCHTAITPCPPAVGGIVTSSAVFPFGDRDFVVRPQVIMEEGVDAFAGTVGVVGENFTVASGGNGKAMTDAGFVVHASERLSTGMGMGGDGADIARLPAGRAGGPHIHVRCTALIAVEILCHKYSSAEDIEWFYEDLQDLLELTPPKDVLFIIGHSNAKGGSREIPGVTDKFGLGIQNEAGKRLTEFCQENALVIANTRFQQCKRRLNQIIIFLQPKMEKIYIQSAKTRLGADCGSDHELLIAKFSLKLNKVGKTTRPFRYDLNQIPYNYTVDVTKRFKGLDLIECLKNYGQRFVTLYRRQ